METKKDRFGEYCGQYVSDILIIMVAYVKKFFSTMYKDQIIATNLLSEVTRVARYKEDNVNE